MSAGRRVWSCWGEVLAEGTNLGLGALGVDCRAVSGGSREVVYESVVP